MKSLGKYLSWVLLAAIFAAAAVAFYGWNLVGDDIVFASRWQAALAKRGALLAYPYYAAVHWLSTNGRMANVLMPFFVGILPRAVVALLLALMVTAMHWAAGRCAGLRNYWARIVMYGLILTTLPWPDSILLYDCQLNYVWAAALGLMAAMLIMGKGKRQGWLEAAAGIVCFIAGSMHEACGVPLAVALWVAVWRREHVDKRLLACFTLGAIVVVASPGIWKRFLENQGTAEWQVGEIIATSLFYYVILLLMVVASPITARGREVLADLCRSPWLVWVVAATLGVPFCLVSGTIGRTGWFAQIFSLIAIFGMLQACITRPGKGAQGVLATVATAMLIFALVHLGYFATWQVRLNREVKVMIERYQASACGIVTTHCTSDNDVPWITLGKQRGVPDSDDVWTLATMREHYATTARQKRQLVILPMGVKRLHAGIDTWVTPKCHLGSKSLATGVIHTYEDIDLHAYRDRNGNIWIEEPLHLEDGTTLYKHTPLETDYGDKRTLVAE